MGQPYDPQYGETSEAYLQAEAETMHEIFAELETSDEGEDVVIDTTGSVIYTGGDILDELTSRTKVFYLEAPLSVQEEMRQRYLKIPKPTIWDSAFNQHEGESESDALARCYPKLLSFRSKEYARLADVTLDYYMLREPNASPELFFEAPSQAAEAGVEG